GEWDETWLIVVSDHGEAFYEHGQPTHGTTLHEEQVRSLLVVRIPGTQPRVVDAPVGLLDLLPSLTRELGLPVHGNFQGASDIFGPDYSADNRPFYFTIQGMTAEDGILLDDWKYTLNWQTGRQQLFDLTRDPGEFRNLIEDEPERARVLHTALEQFLHRQLTYYDRALWRTGFYPARLRGSPGD
ncbi:MAG: sulfatase-like hydrolase/transferase, partial [Thermoanaerobaculia bacterium]|nr:sulfatase-like hydrolase/transferase [Thermoanaerobaculia bacterium]